ISFSSLKKPVVNITNTSTNKAFQVPVDPSCLQSPFNYRNELFAPCTSFLVQKRNACQRAIIELLYFVEPRDLSFIVVDLEDYCSRRLNDGIIMLELQLRASICLNQKDDQDDLAKGANSGLQSHWDTGSRNPFQQSCVLGDQLFGG
ncbi:hypothetical protein Tco_0140491, partial [Tanacetum coccineum]